MQTILDDHKMMQQILATHSPDASVVVDENSILTIAHDILRLYNSTILVVSSGGMLGGQTGGIDS